MGLGTMWNKALVYFGIAEPDDEWDDELSAETELSRSYSERPNVRRLHRSRRREEESFDDWAEPEQPTRTTAPAQGGRRQGRANLEAVPQGTPAGSKVHLVIPRSFNDAQSIADRFKDSVPVILNLQNADAELAKRLIDFSSGLTYALNGSMQRVADKVFLLTPRNVEVSAEERARMADRGFFNQA
ncbi:MAG: cell division protein SepF [Gaiellales bacterium]